MASSGGGAGSGGAGGWGAAAGSGGADGGSGSDGGGGGEAEGDGGEPAPEDEFGGCMAAGQSSHLLARRPCHPHLPYPSPSRTSHTSSPPHPSPTCARARAPPGPGSRLHQVCEWLEGGDYLVVLDEAHRWVGWGCNEGYIHTGAIAGLYIL